MPRAMIAMGRRGVPRLSQQRMKPADSLYHVDLGPPDAPTILFLHGITGSRRYWQKRVRPLSRHYRLVLPDLPGFGRSPKPYVEYTIDLYRDSIRGLVEELNLADRRLILVGHSLGDLIALEYAALYGDHVQRMALFSLPRFTDPVSAHAIFWSGSPHYRRLLNEHSLSETLAQVRRTGLELTLRYMFRFPWSVLIDSHKFTIKSLTSTLEHCLLNYQVDRVLPRIPEIPTLLIHGEKDSVAPLSHVASLPDEYPQMRLATIRGTGHHVFLTHTKRSLALLMDFLEKSDVTD